MQSLDSCLLHRAARILAGKLVQNHERLAGAYTSGHHRHSGTQVAQREKTERLSELEYIRRMIFNAGFYFNTFMVAGVVGQYRLLSFEARKLEFFPKCLSFFPRALSFFQKS